MVNLKVGCHVSAAGGCWNAPKNARELGCETFQIFTRPPQGGQPPVLDGECVAKFKAAMDEYGYESFVVHCPYFVNFGSAEPRIFHGSVSVVKTELERASLLGASYVMTHLGSAKALGQQKALKQTKEGLVKVLSEYEGTTQFLLEIAAGAGEIIGDSFEELAELMEPLVKYKTFGGICFDTQHAFSSGYDLRDALAVKTTFKAFDQAIGLKWLRMSHMNDSKIELGGRKDRHEHIGEGLIGKEGFKAILEYFGKNFQPSLTVSPSQKSSHKTPSLSRSNRGVSPDMGEKNKVLRAMALILETEHDKVKADIKMLKTLRPKPAGKQK